jgi:DNA invertase Pin-like site-specific DNA recombinase
LRGSTQALVNALKEFRAWAWTSSPLSGKHRSTTPTGELIFHVMASLAQFESALISQRAGAGMARQVIGQARGLAPLAQAKQCIAQTPGKAYYESGQQAVRCGLWNSS